MDNGAVLLAYCAGLIAVCTGLLIVATSFTLQNYWLLRRLADMPSGKHDHGGPPGAAETGVTYYDSGPAAGDDIEWTGPVATYPPRRP